MLSPSQIHPQGGPLDWIYYKTILSLWLQVSDDVLHIHAGLLLIVAAALVLRRAPWNWRCWLSAALVEGANELYDVFQTSYVTDEGNWASAWHDFWMTMLWPTVILAVFPWLVRRARRSDTMVAAIPVDEARNADV